VIAVLMMVISGALLLLPVFTEASLANTELKLIIVPEGEDPDDFVFEEEIIPLKPPELTIEPEPIEAGQPFEIILGPIEDEEDNLITGAPCSIVIETTKYPNDIQVASSTDAQATCSYDTAEEAVDQNFSITEGTQEQIDGIATGEDVGAIYGFIDYGDGGVYPAPVNNYQVIETIQGVSGFQTDFGGFDTNNGNASGFGGVFFTTFNTGAQVFVGGGIQTLLRTGGGNFILALVSAALGIVLFLYYKGGKDEKDLEDS
jgi:hypothetical protein